MIWLAGISLFLVGLAVGSFLNVLVFRTLHGYSPWAGRSFCPKCKRKIVWYDNIPLLSFVILGGKCRYCGQKISLQYPVIELLTGNLFLWWYVVGRLVFRLVEQPFGTIQPLFWLGVGIALVLLTGFDWFYGVLPDVIVGGLGAWVLGYRLSLAVSGIMQWSDWWGYVGAGWGGVMALGSLVVLTRGRGMGGGDVKLAGVMGLILGWQKLIVALVLAFLTGAGVAIILVMGKKKTWRQRLAFGPFLVLGTVVALVWGGAIWRWYAASWGLL